jgi:anaerobic selenocysteine-containing dehydrogenase
MTRPPRTWGRSTVSTACTLDCPDSCSLDVTVEQGRVVEIDGNARNPLTNGFICAKVRRFADHVYSSHRLQYPEVRDGAKGSGRFRRVTWDVAMQLIAERMGEARGRHGGEAILPYSYGGSNGLVTHLSTDADLWRAIGASRLARTICAAPTGLAAQVMYGKMPGVAYPDYADARLIVIWGANPSASSIHLVPFVNAARQNGARLIVVDPRATPLARQADLHLPVRPGGDLPLALAIGRYLLAQGHADLAFLDAQASGLDAYRERAEQWTFDRAATVTGIGRDLLERFAQWYAEASPAVIRCGWGLERNRNGTDAVMAVLALPALANKFGVRGGGYTMSNSAAWGIDAEQWRRIPDTTTRIVNMTQLADALTGPMTPPVEVLFVYNSNPVATTPDQGQVVRGLMRDDLFTVVFDQVRTDTAHYADVILPATTFLEHYDVARGYGSYSVQLTRPVIEPVGESRPNAEVFAELAARLGVGDAEDETDTLLRVTAGLPEPIATPVLAEQIPDAPGGNRPVQMIDVLPRTTDGRIHLFPAAPDDQGDRTDPWYTFVDDPASETYPLALISPASEKTISSTLGQLRRSMARLVIHLDDAEARGIGDGDPVRVYNAQGDVHCMARVTSQIAAGTVSLPKGLWRLGTLNGSTSTALTPATVERRSGGACFNDARVEVARIVSAAFDSAEVSVFVPTPDSDVH